MVDINASAFKQASIDVYILWYKGKKGTYNQNWLMYCVAKTRILSLDSLWKSISDMMRYTYLRDPTKKISYERTHGRILRFLPCCDTGHSTISNRHVAGSIMVPEIKLFFLPSLPLRVYSQISLHIKPTKIL